MKPYRFIREADLEFQEQIRYYDGQAAGLGDKFIADVEAIVSDIRQYPQSGRRVSQNLRKRVLRVFRHNVLYVNALLKLSSLRWRRIGDGRATGADD